MSTYLIFNQLQIIHPQFRPKSRSSVLEPSQNFLSMVRARSKEEAICRRGPHKLWLKRAIIRLSSYFRRAIVRTTESALNKSAHGNETRTFKYIAYSRFTFTGRIPNRIPPAGPQIQQPPSGGTWVGSTCNTLKLHDRSCLEMSEADGVDSGAVCKRGFIHLQFAEKPEAPEAERHLGSWILERGRISFLPFGQDRRTLAYIGWQRRWCSRAQCSRKYRDCGRFNFGFRRLSRKYDRLCSSDDRSFRCWIVELCVSRFPNTEKHGAAILAFGGLNSSGVEVAPLLCFLDIKSRVTVSPRVSTCSNLHAVGPGSAVLVLYLNLRSCKYFRANGCTFQHFSKVFSIEFKLNFGVRATYILSYIFLSLGWVPWDGPLGVGFCAGLFLSVLKNRAGFWYSGFRRLTNAVVVVKARAKKKVLCRRGLHKLWLERTAVIFKPIKLTRPLATTR
ncbi:hypothetical protein V1477_019111, partial [Vespula maculifrons]